MSKPLLLMRELVSTLGGDAEGTLDGYQETSLSFSLEMSFVLMYMLSCVIYSRVEYGVFFTWAHVSSVLSFSCFWS